MGSGQILLDGAALRDGRADAGIGRSVRELSAELTVLAPLRVRLVVPPRRSRSESRPGRHLHAERTLLPLAWADLPPLVHGLGGEPLLGWPGARQVVTVHDLELWNDTALPAGPRGVALRAYRRAVGLGLRRCAALVTVSATVREEVVSRLGVAPGRVHVVPGGVSADFRATPAAGDDARRDAIGVPPRYLLWVGSLRHWDPRKALDVLLEALALAGPAAPPLLLAGVPGQASDQAEDQAAASGVALRAIGTVDDPTLAALYRGSAAVILPSRHEGFGLTALEAMACATPLICSDAGNLPTLAGSTAHVVAAGDPRALARALTHVLDDPESARRRALEGAATASRYTWRRAAEQTLSLYDALLNPPP
ncbi:MAG: glycosyltransferase family 4 protein [Candidatus Dormibacteria bacterium]